MATLYELDLGKIKNKLLLNAIKTVGDITNEIFLDVKKFSPIDTGKYVNSHRNLGVRIEGNTVIGEISNSMPYSEKVEFGWRKTAVNWHLKNLPGIFNNVGANVYKRAIEKNKINFKNKIG